MGSMFPDVNQGTTQAAAALTAVTPKIFLSKELDFGLKTGVHCAYLARPEPQAPHPRWVANSPCFEIYASPTCPPLRARVDATLGSNASLLRTSRAAPICSVPGTSLPRLSRYLVAASPKNRSTCERSVSEITTAQLGCKNKCSAKRAADARLRIICTPDLSNIFPAGFDQGWHENVDWWVPSLNSCLLFSCTLARALLVTPGMICQSRVLSDLRTASFVFFMCTVSIFQVPLIKTTSLGRP